MKLGVSYFGNRMPQSVEEDMKKIKDNGCNFIVHTFSETDLEYYPGTMEKIVNSSKKCGLEVWLDPWGVGRVWGGESYSELIAKDLDVRQINAEGHSLPIACLNNPSFVEFMKKWTDAALQCGADVLFWDEPHFYIYPEDEGCRAWACKCKHCQKLFKKRFSEAMPSLLNDNLREFKEDSIVDFLTKLCDYAKKKNVINSMCFLPFENSSTVNNWEKVAKIKNLDIIGSDPYWRKGQSEEEIIERVGSFSKRIQDLSLKHNKEGQIWILNFAIEKGKESDIELAVETAYKEGIRDIAAWSYYGTAQMSSLACDDPETTWKTLGKVYKRLSKLP